MLYYDEENWYRRKTNRVQEQESVLEEMKKTHQDLGAILDEKMKSYLERNPKAEAHQIARVLSEEGTRWEQLLDRCKKDW